MSAVRKAVEAVLPWYDPQVEAVKDQHVDKAVTEAKVAVDKLASYARVSARRR